MSRHLISLNQDLFHQGEAFFRAKSIEATEANAKLVLQRPKPIDAEFKDVKDGPERPGTPIGLLK